MVHQTLVRAGGRFRQIFHVGRALSSGKTSSDVGMLWEERSEDFIRLLTRHYQ